VEKEPRIAPREPSLLAYWCGILLWAAGGVGFVLAFWLLHKLAGWSMSGWEG
jgi:hypothetical protein